MYMERESTVMDQSSDIKNRVQERYGDLAGQVTAAAADQQQAAKNSWAQVVSRCCDPTSDLEVQLIQVGDGVSCCQPVDVDALTLAEALYGQSAIADLPNTVTDISLGCGNPTAIANLKPGETVLDLGSGGGIDCFLAAKAVGPTGYVIGVDMTDRMLALAKENLARLGASNVEFRKGEIEDLPVESTSVDVVISNCVINLSPDKDAVFREAFRVLKPGGRFAVSDMVTEGEFPDQLRKNVEAWAGCITGALDQEDYLERLRQAGFADVAVESRSSYGLENLESLDQDSREALGYGVDWQTVPPEVRLYSARIVAGKPQ
jgi:SAM-dependent methyltransferase